MNSYNQLSGLVLTACKSFFDKFDFKVTVDRGHELTVENHFCLLRFIVDERLDYKTQYETKGLQYTFELFEIFKFLKPYETRKYFETSFYRSIVDQREISLVTKIELDFLNNNLQHILLRDASWTTALIDELEYRKKLVEFVFKKFTHGHPIKKQYFKCNPAWQTNLEIYLAENNIVIPEASNISRYTRNRNRRTWWKFWQARL